jgi:hypothetical protein
VAEPEPEPEIVAPDRHLPERPVEADASAEPAWDRDRYTARIEEPDWIPEERESHEIAAAPMPPPDRVEPPPAATQPQSAGWDAGWEPDTPAQPAGGPPGSLQEETMLWYGREPGQPPPPWPAEDDFAAEMEIASTGGQLARSPWVPEEPPDAGPEPAAPASVPRSEPVASSPLAAPSSPASRAYRRLRRIFPG